MNHVRLLFVGSRFYFLKEELVEESHLRQLPAEIIGDLGGLLHQFLHTSAMGTLRLYGGNRRSWHRTSPKQGINLVAVYSDAKCLLSQQISSDYFYLEDSAV